MKTEPPHVGCYSFERSSIFPNHSKNPRKAGGRLGRCRKTPTDRKNPRLHVRRSGLCSCHLSLVTRHSADTPSICSIRSSSSSLKKEISTDRKSTRLNSSHLGI